MIDLELRVLDVADHGLLCAVADGLFDHPIDPVQTAAFLNDPLHHIVLAFDGREAVGMASGTVLFHPDKAPAFFVNEVATRDGWTRRGVARAVCTRLFDLAREIGCRGIWLGTETDNVAAIGLYRALKANEMPGIFFGWDDAL